MTKTLEIASARKVAWHAEKLAAYLDGERIFPSSLELDLTTECNRRCPVCPSTTAERTHRLTPEFIERLLSFLSGETRGLLLSGGEPTMADTFHHTLCVARRNGFEEIAVATNGDFLGHEPVAEALCENATAVRVSFYDWSLVSPAALARTLRRIEKLRERIERTGSSLEIGVSALTTADNARRVPEAARAAASAGAHWIYFHPFCIRWDEGAPERIAQLGVQEAVDGCRTGVEDGFRILSFADRYLDDEIRFSGYHAAHFLLVVGADAVNYLGAEVKYQPAHALARMDRGREKLGLWTDDRLARISAVQSNAYPALGSRHRGILYNHVIQEMIDRGEPPASSGREHPAEEFLYPHIL